MLVNTIWIGKKLGPVHAACLRSFVRYGHDVVLHAYGAPDDTPKGVRLFDASRLMDEKEIFAHKDTGSLSIAADVYRYRIQREGMGLYVDSDVYCLAEFSDSDYILSYEANSSVSNAIIKIPHDSELLKSILNASEDRYFIPPWFSERKRTKLALRKALGFPVHVANQKWGIIGPSLFTYHVDRLGLQDKVAPIDKYSPLYGGHTNLLFEKGLTLSNLITPRTVGIHLYNSFLKGKEIIPDTPLFEIVNS